MRSGAHDAYRNIATVVILADGDGVTIVMTIITTNEAGNE